MKAPLGEFMNTTVGAVIGTLCIAMLSLIPLLLTDEPGIADMMALLCFAPTVIAVIYAKRRLYDVASWQEFFAEYTLGYCILAPLVLIATILATIFVAGVVGAVVPFKYYIARVLFTVLLALVFAGAEVVTMYVMTVKRYTTGESGGTDNPREYVVKPLFASLGIATFEAFLCSLLVWRAIQAELHRYHEGDQRRGAEDPHPFVLFVIITVACLVFLPSHALSGYYIGLGVAKRRVLNQPTTAARVVVVPLLFRAAFFHFIFFSSNMTHGITLILAIPLLVVYLRVVKSAEREMPQDYLSRTGYLSLGGYGVIGSMDMDGDDDDEAGEFEDGLSDIDWGRDAPAPLHPHHKPVAASAVVDMQNLIPQPRSELLVDVDALSDSEHS